MFGVLENLELTDRMVWMEHLITGPACLRIGAVLDCYSTCKTPPSRALLAFQFKEEVTGEILAGSGLTFSDMVGPYIYLNTRPGVAYSDLVVMVPKGTTLTRIGIRNWYAEGPILAKYVWIEPAPEPQSDDVLAMISVDVEALPARAHEDHLKKLIYGHYNGADYGIPRLCAIFEEYKIPANFMLDYSECALYGDQAIFRVGDELRGRGHDVQLHFHSEWIIRNQNWVFPGGIFPGFANLNHAQARRVLEYGCEKYFQNFGRQAEFFRSGGFLFNKETLVAAQGVGLRGTSMVRNNPEAFAAMSVCPNTGEPFFWENGLLEIPVDLSPEPLSDFLMDRFRLNYFTAYARKKIRTFNLVLHSWSLLRRDAEGFVAEPTAVLEKNLREMLEYLSQHARFTTYSDMLRDIPPSPAPGRWLPELTVEVAAPQNKTPPRATVGCRTCNICGTHFETVPKQTEACPFCTARTHDRILKWVFDAKGNPLAGRRVIAWHATPLERKIFLSDAAELFICGTRAPDCADAFMDIQDLASLGTGQYDGLLAIHVLNLVAEDAKAVAEIARVLKPGGMLIATVPYQTGNESRANPRRVYNLEHFEKLLESHFTVKRMPGYDPLASQSQSVFLCAKKQI